MTETKAQRIARKFGVAARAVNPSANGVGANRPTSSRRSQPRRATAVEMLVGRLARQFNVSCTGCFESVLAEMASTSPDQMVERSEDVAKALYENAKEKGAGELLAWANYRKNGLRLYRELIMDAFEPFIEAPRVDTTFVWLYLDQEKQSDELRWSIRSVLANYNGQASVVLFGDKPSWYCGEHVPMARVGKQTRRRYRDTLNKLHAACNSQLVPNTFVWMMDDTYFLRRVSFRDLAVNRFQGVIPPGPWGNPEWRQLQADTYTVIREANLKSIDYCTHLPKVVEKQRFLEMWDRFDLGNRVLQWELLYGAMFYENYRPVDSRFFNLIRDRQAVANVRRSVIVNNGTRGWCERLRAELFNRFPIQSAFECVTESPPNWAAAGIPCRRYNYEIKTGYRCRAENNAGIAVPDDAQRNVYEFASDIPGVRTVIDWGTGSGSKLTELFKGRLTIGVDVEEKVRAARERFPDGDWRVLPIPIDCDLLIVADVIEHLADPMALIATIKSGNWRHCVISTPERDLARGVNDLGPPANPRHVREWNTGEFVRFIRGQGIGEIASVQVLGKYNLVVHLIRPSFSPGSSGKLGGSFFR